jgi:hypothetical protein
LPTWRALAGGEAEFFQSLFEELSNVPLAVDDANATHDFFASGVIRDQPPDW